MPLTRSVDVFFAAKQGDEYLLLLLRRAKTDSYGGMLKPIGGKAEEDEPLMETIQREAMEEGGNWLAEEINQQHFSFMLRLNQKRTETRIITNALIVLDSSVEEINKHLVMEEGVTFEWLSFAAAARLVDGGAMKQGVPEGVDASFMDTKVAAIRAHTILGDPVLRGMLKE